MNKKQLNQQLDLQELKQKAASFCAYQERSTLEAKQKLQKLGANQEQISIILDFLLDEGFVDETRFARVYANGKFKQNKWGRIKIAHALQQKGISKSLIEESLNCLDNDSYLQTIKKLVEKKNKEVKEKDLWVRKNKIAQSVSLKGYESDLVFQVIDETLKT